MHAWPDAPAVRAYLARSVRRLRVMRALEGAAAGLVVAVAIVVVRRSLSPLDGVALAAGFAIAGALARVFTSRVTNARAALSVETRVPSFRNVLVTASELLDDPSRVREYVGRTVMRDAARVAGEAELGVALPLGRSLLSVATASALFVIASAMRTNGVVLNTGTPGAGSILSIDIGVTPPAYSVLPSETLHNPTRVDALAASAINVTVGADADSVTIETLTGRRALQQTAPRTFAYVIPADADGFIAVESFARGASRDRRLIGLAVRPDEPARVRITQPAHDLFLPDAAKTINVSIEASDDLALESLRLRYTKVSGSGELFTFSEGEFPIQVTRTDARAWKATGQIRLPVLKLITGDVVVYRGIATDRRPGAPPSESDSFIIEIAPAGSVASEGFATDDERDRYGISQAMVILKTERLIASRASMTTDSVAAETMQIAAEQRAVRAEFVFMLGGEVAEEVLNAENLADLNEEAEARGEEDIAAGRLANRGRLDVVLAIRSMSQASTSLTAKEIDKALIQERAALKYLQAAFSRTRYILRALSKREQLDVARRMTGTLAGAARDARAVPRGEPAARVVLLRRSLADLSALAASRAFDSGAIRAATIVTQDLLRVDPASKPLQDVAVTITRAMTAMRNGRSADVRARLDSASVNLAALIRAQLARGSLDAPSVGAARLEGALTDALRERDRR